MLWISLQQTHTRGGLERTTWSWQVIKYTDSLRWRFVFFQKKCLQTGPCLNAETPTTRSTTWSLLWKDPIICCMTDNMYPIKLHWSGDINSPEGSSLFLNRDLLIRATELGLWQILLYKYVFCVMSNKLPRCDIHLITSEITWVWGQHWPIWHMYIEFWHQAHQLLKMCERSSTQRSMLLVTHLCSS